MANALSIDCERLARAGIAITAPEASEMRVRYLVMARRYGDDLATAVLGDGRC